MQGCADNTIQLFTGTCIRQSSKPWITLPLVLCSAGCQPVCSNHRHAGTASWGARLQSIPLPLSQTTCRHPLLCVESLHHQVQGSNRRRPCWHAPAWSCWFSTS